MGNGDFISIATNDEKLELCKQYYMEIGNEFFKLCNTNIDSDMYIIAQGIDVQIIE